MRPLTFGSLFAGIGGLDLGLERAGFECRWQVEIDDYARRVLARHWPDVRRHDDVKTFPPTNPEEWSVDLICGGFPCQDISYAGKGAGLAGERSGLWFEFARVVRELRPRFVLVENVPALVTRGLDSVLGTLASLGYDAEWGCVPAAAVGAPHVRDRIFILAERSDAFGVRVRVPGRGEASGAAGALQGEAREREWIRPDAGSVGEDVADPEGVGRGAGRARRVAAHGEGCGVSPGCPVADAGRPGPSVAESERKLRGPVAQSGWWAVEPEVGRVADGIPRRVDRLRGLGNAVVPQVAEHVGRGLMAYIRSRSFSAPAAVRGPIRPPVKIHGGKHPLAGSIVALMPPHERYVEPFLGGGSVLLAKPRCEHEYASDLDAGLVRMWVALRDRPDEVRAILGRVAHGEDAWEGALASLGHEDDAIAAAARIVRSRMSRGGLGNAFGRSTRRRGGQDEYRNAWETFLRDDLPAICERARGVSFRCSDFIAAIVDRDDRTLIYLDPPYLPSTRTAKKVYAHEMTEDDHRMLLDLIRQTPAKVMLSGYRNPTYDDALRDWNRVDRDVANHASQSRSKARRTESIWANF